MKRGLTSLTIFLLIAILAGCSGNQEPSPSSSIAFYSPPGYSSPSPAASFAPSTTLDTSNQIKMYVNIDIDGSLNVRESASSDSRVIGVLRKNDVVLILEQNVSGQWHKIQTYNGTTGYCISSYLKPTSAHAALADLTIYNGDGSASESPIVNPTQGTSSYIKIVLDSGALNVRKSPSTTSEVVGSLNNGEVVKAELNVYTGWHKVFLTNGAVGYIKSEFAETISSPESPSPSKSTSSPKPSKTVVPSPDEPTYTPSHEPSTPSPSEATPSPSPSPSHTDTTSPTATNTPSPSSELSITPSAATTQESDN